MARKRLPPELVYEITRCVRAHDGWFGVYASTRMIQNFLAFQLEKWAEVGLITIFDRLRAKEATATQSGSGISLTNKEIRDVLLIGQEIKGLRTLFSVVKLTNHGKAMADYAKWDPTMALFYREFEAFLGKYSQPAVTNAPPLPATPVPLMPQPRFAASASPATSMSRWPQNRVAATTHHLPATAPPTTPVPHGPATSVSRWPKHLPATIQMYGEPDQPGPSHHQLHPSARVAHRPPSTTKTTSKSGRPSASTAQIRAADPCAGLLLHTSGSVPHARSSAGAKKRWQH